VVTDDATATEFNILNRSVQPSQNLPSPSYTIEVAAIEVEVDSDTFICARWDLDKPVKEDWHGEFSACFIQDFPEEICNL